MQTENDIVSRIIRLCLEHKPSEDKFLSDRQQHELITLYSVLGRQLNILETERLAWLRKKVIL